MFKPSIKFFPKFSAGDYVKIVRLLDGWTNPDLIGKRGRIVEIDDLPNGGFNYEVVFENENHYAFHYMHQEELELDLPTEVMHRMVD
jgi:hypothetical protein